MKQLEVMPNLMPAVATLQIHRVPLDPACPVSGNPKAGSTLEITYRPQHWHLEIYSLRAFVDQFKGGLRYPHMPPGQYVVRDQEHMVQFVAQFCADAVGVEVQAIASLTLSDGATTSDMILQCTAQPAGVTGKVSRFAS